jgi:hypothetical protein
MTSKSARAILFAIALVAWTAVVYRTRSGEWAPPRPADELAMKEYLYVATRLEAIQERALRDPALQRMNEALGETMLAAMDAVDPGLADALRRVPELEVRRVSEHDPVHPGASPPPSAELAEIERRYRDAQQEALLLPDLAEEVGLFHHLLRRRMIQQDAAADSLLTRFQELGDRLGLESSPLGP